MSQGFSTLVAIEDANPPTKGFEVVSCALTKQASHIDASGLRGNLDHRSERVRAGLINIGGTIVFEPSPEDLALIFPWVFGQAASGTTYSLAQTLATRYVAVDKVAKVYTYAGCCVNRMTLEGQQGAPMRLTLDILGKTETEGNAGSLTGLSYTNTAPFTLYDTTLTMVSSARNCSRWTLTIDNNLEGSFYNSQTISRITPRDRTITFSCDTPWTSSETDLYNQAVAGTAATLALAFDAYSLSFAFAKLQVPAEGPTIGGRNEIPLTLNGVARMSGTTAPLITTLDSTP